MIKFKNIINKLTSKTRYNIIDEFEKEHINGVINISNIENEFDSELIQLIIDHTCKKTIVYKLNIKSVISTLTKRPTLNKKNNNYMVDIPTLEKIDEWSGLSYELENSDSAFSSIYNVFKVINKYNSSKVFIFLPEYTSTNFNVKLTKYCCDLEKHSKAIVLNPYFKFIKLHSENKLSYVNTSLRCMSWINYGISPSIIVNYGDNYIHLTINIDNWKNPITFKINLNLDTLLNYFSTHTENNSTTQKWQNEYFYELNNISQMIPKALYDNTNTTVITLHNDFFNLANLLNFEGIKNIVELLSELCIILNNSSDLTEYCYLLILITLFNSLKKKLGSDVEIIIHNGLHKEAKTLTSSIIVGYFIDYMNFDFKKQLC